MILRVEDREVVGKKVKKLRSKGLVPGSIYGPKRKSLSIQLAVSDFRKIFKEVGYSNLFEVAKDGKSKLKVLLKEVQINPVTDEILHVSLYEVDMKTTISADVPLEVTGESPAVKNNIGLLVVPVSTVSIICLPADLPSKLSVDVSKLNEIGDSVLVSTIKLPDRVELDSDIASNLSLAYISAPQKVIEEEEVETDLEEGEEEEEGAEKEPGKEYTKEGEQSKGAGETTGVPTSGDDKQKV